jgi:hypothetical protein
VASASRTVWDAGATQEREEIRSARGAGIRALDDPRALRMSVTDTSCGSRQGLGSAVCVCVLAIRSRALARQTGGLDWLLLACLFLSSLQTRMAVRVMKEY